MQIQRMIDDSIGVRDEDKTGMLRTNFSEVINNEESSETMRVIGPLSASTRQTTKSLKLEIDANQSFLHGSTDNEKSPRRNIKVSDERLINDRLIYATIDSLALKRARLPLQLLPIDENCDSIEKRENNDERRVVASNRKSSSPRRPSFKVRPGASLTGQWKPRVRSNPRSQTEPKKLENVSKESVKSVIIFENTINRDCDILDTSSTLTTDQKVPALPETSQLIHDEYSNVNQTNSLRDFVESEEEQNPTNFLESKNSDHSRTTEEEKQQFPNESDSIVNKKLTSESNVTRTDIDVSSIENLRKIVTIFPGNKSLPIKTKRYRPGFTFAKTVLNYVPISGRAKRGKKSKTTNNNNSKNRKKTVRDSSDETSNLESGEKKNISRKELLSASISSPTNFVHLSSATTSQLLTNGDTSLKSCTNKISRGKLEYHVDYQEFEVVKESSIGRNIANKSKDDETIYVKIQETALKSSEVRHSVGYEKSLEASHSSFSDNERENKDGNRAKVESLENSQGVPEVVKISENEDDVRLHVKESDTIAPVYEAMSEFSINRRSPRSNVPDGAASTSFLWETRRAACRINEKEFIPTTTADEKIVISTGDNSIDENGYDAYDDVGLSRLDSEEDLYDDVDLPVTLTKSSSTHTIFEEINVDGNSQLYDDVLPSPITTKVSAIISSLNEKSGSTIKQSAVMKNRSIFTYNESNENKSSFDKNYVNSSKSAELLENDENQYLSIGNDYSSVEERLDELGDETQEDCLYDDVELPSHQERVNSLYAGSSSGSQLSSLYNGKESEWEDLEEAAPVLPFPKKNTVTLRNADSQASSSKKKIVQRRSRNVRRQKSKASRKNVASRSTSRSAVRETPTFTDTASDDSNYETLHSSFPSDEFSSGSDDDESVVNSSMQNGVSSIDNRFNEVLSQEAPSKPIPPPPRESSLTHTLGKRMKMLRKTWSITKGGLGRIRRRASTANADNATSNNDDTGNKYANCDDQNGTNYDGRKHFSIRKHFRKSISGLSTFYLEDESPVDERLSSNNNRSKGEICKILSGSNLNWYANTEYWQMSLDDQSRKNNVDHYSMLDEEPLYQFYAAQTARVAFESDSEGYEEVEDPMPLSWPSTVDLATKPGHRTLWCQTPQVVESKLLQLLTPDEKKVQEAKFEILTSEAAYLNSLRVLVDEFLNNHDLVYEVLTPNEREKLFGDVPKVLIASERLLAELETVWREDVMLQGLPEILLDYAQRSSSVYVAYCSNQVSIDTTLKELRSRKGSKFIDTITRIELHPACQSLTLHSFLMLPMQRVTRLPLLADAILSKLSTDNKEERTRWECVLTQLSQVALECNEGARAAGRLAEVEALERKLEYSAKIPPIVLRDRYLVRRGPVVQMLAKTDADYKLTFGKKNHKISLYLFLLTDYLLITKPKSIANEETYKVIDSCKRSLVALEKVPEDSPFAGRNAMILTLLENYAERHVEYILTCNNATERERWLDAVSPPKPCLVGETLYETWDCPQVMALHPYAASQPDELTLQPGDVINVLRKMMDGWHLGEKLMGGEQGWFPGNYAAEVASEHVRARNLRQRHRILARSASFLQQRVKRDSRLH